MSAEPLNDDQVSSEDEEVGTSAKKGMEYLKREQSKEVAKLRRQALIKGMQAGTSGMAQDCIYLLLDMVSQALVVGQLYINLKSVFGGEGCQKGKAVSLEVVWFYVQLSLNALVTVGQFVIWIWGFGMNGMFCCSYQKCPTSKDAQCSSPMIAYRELLAKLDGVELDDMDDDEKAEALEEYPDDEELRRDEDFKKFKKEIATLGKINSLQSSLTNGRAGIGALGAMVEPALAAASGMAAMNTGATVPKASMKCLTARQVSATGSGIIAAIGIRQAAMKSSYQRLVMLAQMREKDVEQYEKAKAKGGNAKRRVTDEAIETELQDLLGPQGKKALSYLSGQEAPEK